jgi:hypothetical protein
MITRFAKRIGMILMIVPASRVTEERHPSLGKPFGEVGEVDLEGSRPGRREHNII